MRECLSLTCSAHLTPAAFHSAHSTTAVQAWYAAHPPKRGIPLITRPYVHQVGTLQPVNSPEVYKIWQSRHVLQKGWKWLRAAPPLLTNPLLRQNSY